MHFLALGVGTLEEKKSSRFMNIHLETRSFSKLVKDRGHKAGLGVAGFGEEEHIICKEEVRDSWSISRDLEGEPISFRHFTLNSQRKLLHAQDK